MHERSAEKSLRALVSIHDVMPETRLEVSNMLDRLALPAKTVTLLVVPGRQWGDDDLAWLRGLQSAGHPLAGHGWFHRCQPPVTLYHKLHSMMLSRQVAEHLSFSGAGIVKLVRECHDWFGQHDLEVSPLYVPPAWAMGRLTPQQLAELPFRYVETLTGLLDTQTGGLTSLPLVGFEADTPLRALFLEIFNTISTHRARTQRLPLRIGLHPFDLSYRLAPRILTLLQQVSHFEDYDELPRAGMPVLPSLPQSHSSRQGHSR